MKITVEQTTTGENEVILKYRELDREMQDVLHFLQHSSAKILAQKDKETFLLQPHEVYFVESVDNRVFLYTKEHVLEVQEPLASFEHKYEHAGLVRIGKSQLVNLHRIKKLKSVLNSRIEVTLESGDKLIVSRHYARSFKSRLGLNH